MAEETKNPFGEGFEKYVPGEFIKWDKAKVLKGVLTHVEYDQPNNLDPGKTQTVYTLKLDDGKEVRMASPSIDRAMKDIRVGQNVGIDFQGKKPSKKNPGKTYNHIDIYPGPMSEQAELDQAAEDFGGEVL